jgi:hypothetical protein
MVIINECSTLLEICPSCPILFSCTSPEVAKSDETARLQSENYRLQPFELHPHQETGHEVILIDISGKIKSIIEMIH